MMAISSSRLFLDGGKQIEDDFGHGRDHEHDELIKDSPDWFWTLPLMVFE